MSKGLSVLALSLPGLAAEVVELRPVADASIHAVAPNQNMGGHSHVAIGTTAKNTPARGLFRFDLATIPPGATINSVTLTFNLPALNRPDSTSAEYSIHRLLRPWGEGTKTGNLGAVGSAGEATWQHSAIPAEWSAPGGQEGVDYAGAPSATQAMGPAPGVYVVRSAAGLVADLQAWISRPGENFGWLLKAEDELLTQTARQFSSRETTNAPVLRVEYAAQLPELRITGIERAGTNIMIRWTFSGSVGVQSANSLPGNWRGIGESSAGSFTNALSAETEYFRLVD
jgi:hypothetical protein